MADENINLNIRIDDPRGGANPASPTGGPVAGSGGGSPSGGSSGVRQPTPEDIRTQGSRGVRDSRNRATTADLRDQWNDSRSGEQASTTEELLKSFGLTRGIGNAIGAARNARNKQAFGEWRKEYRTWEKQQDSFASENVGAIPPTPSNVQPPDFRPGGQNFVPTVAQPLPGSAPPLPGGGPSTPPTHTPGEGVATSHGAVPPVGGSGSPSGGPPKPPGPSGGGIFPNMGGASGAALAGLAGAAAGMAIGVVIAGIAAVISGAVEAIKALMNEFKASVNKTAPFSAPVLESLIQEQLQILADNRYRAVTAGEGIAQVNNEMVRLNSELNRLMTEFMKESAPIIVESLQTLTVIAHGYREIHQLQWDALDAIVKNVPALKFLASEAFRKWNDLETEKKAQHWGDALKALDFADFDAEDRPAERRPMFP